MNQSTTRNFPIPNDTHPDGTVVASVWYRDDDEFQLATILVLRPAAPFFRVGVWNITENKWDGTDDDPAYVDHMNIVHAIQGEAQHDGQGHFTGERKWGYIDFGGDV